MSNINWSEVDRLVAEGYISARRHLTEPLTIYNYTAKCQYEPLWTPETRQCRGLIANDDRVVVARPFPKFHNFEEHSRSEIAFSKPFVVAEKIDGSLGVLYSRSDGQLAIATRGSFTSPQAQHGTSILRECHADFQPFDGLTYLFEIIYPENRIVVDYGRRRELVLLAVIDTATGRDFVGPSGWHGARAEAFTVDCRPRNVLDEIHPSGQSNAEGYVLRFDWPKTGPQFRCKIKLAEYVRLHRLMTGLNARDVWENAMAGKPVEAMLADVPDEFFAWVRDIDDELRRQFAEIEAEAKAALYPNAFTDRKEAALWITKQKHPAVMFAMLDGKDYASIIWKGLKPEGGVTFRCQSEATA